MQNVRTTNPDLYTRRCLCCGAAAEWRHADHCDECGCNLRERPPRSYAEMEGLTAAPRPEIVEAARRAPRSVNPRWLSFLLLVFVGLLLVMYLATAALP